MEEMNLNTIKDALKTSDREVEFKVSGKATGWIWKLRHESSPEVQAVMKQFQAKVRELALKRKNSAYQNLVADNEDKLRVAHVAGWTWTQGVDEANGRPAFTKQELKNLLDGPIAYHVKNFIDEEVGSLEDFLSKSENS